MTGFWKLVRKDLVILLRNPSSLVMIILLPLLIATLFGSINRGGAEDGSRRLKIFLVDEDMSDTSRDFAKRLVKNGGVDALAVTRDEAFEGLRRGRRPVALIILPGFGERLSRFPLATEAASVELRSDPRRGQVAGILIGEAMRAAIGVIEARMNAAAGPIAGGRAGGVSLRPLKVTVRSFVVERSVPTNAFAITIPQAALWSILSAVAIMSGSLAMERAQQTLQRLRVSPISPLTVLGSKVVACILTIMASTAVVVAFGIVVFGIRVSSLPLLATAMALSGLCFSGIMLAIGSMGRNPASVTGLAWGLMVLFAMLGGGMIPQLFMPEWLQLVGGISPGKWAVLAMEGAIWRRFSLAESLPAFAILFLIGVLGIAIGVRRLSRAEFS